MTIIHRSNPRVLIATGNSGLNEALGALLARHSPEIGRPASILDDVTRQPSLRLLLIAEIENDSGALELLQEVKQRRPDIAVLLFSSHPTVEHATESMRRGAEDFVPVPYSEEVVCKEVERILEAADLRERLDDLNQLVATQYGFERIISGSRPMQLVFDRARAAARSDTPVLIFGETGTGKELIARAIHANSRRSKRAFVPVNSAALPHDLVESELFGHRRGAFSGAFADYPGLFVGAHGGTLFLDEIGELPLDAQAKLLRVLQDGEVRPVGALEKRHVDVRIIAATNRTLADVRDGRLRQDVFFRLSVLVIEIPPLRERRQDLPLLIAHFLSGIRQRGVRSVEGVDADALDLLADYAFPGNVRELENMLEALALTLPSGRDTIDAGDVRRWLRRAVSPRAEPVGEAGTPVNLGELESWAIAEALGRSHGNKRLAAHLLGISRDTLYRKLHEREAEASKKIV